MLFSINTLKLPNQTRNDQKVGFAFCNSPEYKIKRQFTFLVNTKYISSSVVKISADTLALRTRENTDFSPYLTKYI